MLEISSKMVNISISLKKKGYGNRLVGMIENLKNLGRARSMGRVVLKLDHPEINLVLDEKV